MDVIRWDWQDVARGDTFRIIPIADVHLGLRTCDEGALSQVIKRIQEDDSCYWIGLGDLCDFINRQDKRFDSDSLAPWLAGKGDIAKAQEDRFLGHIEPIANKCLALLSGNHEQAIYHKTERDVYSEIVTAIKEKGGHGDRRLGLGSCGWLVLRASRARNGAASTSIRIAMHHGYVSGRLAGGTALDLERWLSYHSCDVGLLGHSHKVQTMSVDVEEVDRNGNIVYMTRKGAICGSFINGGKGPDTYVHRKGYRHQPCDTVTVELRPGAERQPDRVRIVT